MRRSCLRQSCVIIFMAALSCPSTGAGATASEGRASDTAELTRLAKESGHAYARRDLAALDRLTAEDYVQTDVRGGVLDRAQWLDFVKNRQG